MKKFAIGCLVVLVVVVAAVAGIGYYGYLKVKGTVAQLAELGQVADIERDVRVKTAFVPPGSREMTAAQVDRLVQVQARVRERLGAGVAAIERNYKSLLDNDKKEANITDLPALLGAYRDLAKTLIDGKKAQVEALNDFSMSLDEYRWIRTESYRALGVPFVDMDISRLAERARSGQNAGVIEMNGALGDKGPDANVKLVEKHRKALEDFMALASFGL